MYSRDIPPVVVVVGNYGVGKSSFVKALLGDTDRDNKRNIKARKRLNINSDDEGSRDSASSSHSNTNSELDMDMDELIVEAQTVNIDGETVRIVDTAARDVMGTQQQMQTADLVIVLMNASSSKSIEDLDEYWIEQFADITLHSPLIACFNQIDRLSQTELTALKNKFSSPTKEHFVLESILYCSAFNNKGIHECKYNIISILRDIRDKPRWILIDPYTWKLQSLFECALHRIFRLLDRDDDNVLNLNELKYFNKQILDEDFNANIYNLLLRRLNAQNDSFVTPQGLTFLGFTHLMKRFAIAKKWDRCWDVLRFFHYKNDLTLHERVFPTLPSKENDQTFELSINVYILLEKLFYKFADDTIMDSDNKSIATSSMISDVQQQFIEGDNDDDEHDEDDDTNKLLSFEGIKRILSVLPSTKSELHCTLLDRHVIDHFETAGKKLNKLTKNGWLSFWAMFAVENYQYCFKQLTYLDLSSDTDRNLWYKLTQRKIYDHKGNKINRSVIRILLFGGPQCGKTQFCDRLLCRIPRARRLKKRKSRYHSTQHFRAVSNRIGASNEYNFLAITEVPAINQYIEQAMDNFLCAYDMILLMFDLSQSRSFYELNKIFDRMPKNHNLPIQVLATKSDLKNVKQYNLEKKGNVSYNPDLNIELNQLGLYQFAQTWLTYNDSCDFPQLFDDIFFIATNPHFRRLIIENNFNNNDNNHNNMNSNINWKTILKRTVTITCGVSIVIYSAYRIYRWWYISAAPPNNARSAMVATKRYKR